MFDASRAFVFVRADAAARTAIKDQGVPIQYYSVIYEAIDDVRAVAAPALRHRLRLSYEADADRADADTVIAHLLASVPLALMAKASSSPVQRPVT